MTILLLTDELLPGGVSKYVVDVALALSDKGHRVTVAATEGPYRQKLTPPIQFLHLPLLRKNSYSKQMTGFFRSLLILLRHLKKEQYDIIHSQKRYSDLLGRIAARLYGIPHISTCHNTFENLRTLSVFGDYTIATSHSIASILIQRYQKKQESVFTIYNGIHPLPVLSGNEKESFRASLGIFPDQCVIASVGQLIPSKDRMTLLKAINILVSRQPSFSAVFLIVGEGYQKPMIEEYISTHALTPYVRLLPANSDITAIFNISDFAVLSSVREAVPYVFREAASVGKPYVATNVGGVSEFIEDGRTGLLVPPQNPELLAEAILRLLQDESLRKRLGQQAYEKCMKEFTFEQFIEKTFLVYDYVLGNTRKNL